MHIHVSCLTWRGAYTHSPHPHWPPDHITQAAGRAHYLARATVVRTLLPFASFRCCGDRTTFVHSPLQASAGVFVVRQARRVSSAWWVWWVGMHAWLRLCCVPRHGSVVTAAGHKDIISRLPSVPPSIPPAHTNTKHRPKKGHPQKKHEILNGSLAWRGQHTSILGTPSLARCLSAVFVLVQTWCHHPARFGRLPPPLLPFLPHTPKHHTSRSRRGHIARPIVCRGFQTSDSV